jgi:hypothetical protein
MPTLLSGFLGVTPEALDTFGVFDSFIDLDSQLHVDPHLLAESSIPEMQEAREVVSKYFEDTVDILALSEKPSDTLFDAGYKRLVLSELKGVSLGYSKDEGDGSAVGPGLARILAERALHIVKAGEKDPRIFELVGLFTEDFGSDRISDVVLRIADTSFAKYTSRVASALGVPTTRVEIRSVEFHLPIDRTKGKERPLIFVPKDVLRELPVALSYTEIAAVGTYNATVRDGINELFATVGRGKRPTKGDMWARVTANPDLVKSLVQAYIAATGIPYDFALDPAAEHSRFLTARALATQHPLRLTKPQTGWTSEFATDAVMAICNHFKGLVEKNGLWDSFWIRKKKPARTLTERAMQRVFFGIALTYCKDGNPDLDISPETNAGPGPVDFKFSHGATIKVTVEMKKSNHSRLLHGYETQLKLYNAAERTDSSVFLIVRVGDDDSKIQAVRTARKEALARGEKAPAVVVVDARPQDSASIAENL